MVVGGERGFTLVETLIAVGILALAIVGLMAAFANQAASNTRSEHRSSAATAAEQRLEFLRLEDPELMPTSGSVGPMGITVNELQYEIYTHFCTRNQYCGDRARHLLVEVHLDGEKVYDVETVYTQLQ